MGYGQDRNDEAIFRTGLRDVKDVQAEDDTPVMAAPEGIIFGLCVGIAACLLIAWIWL